MRLPPFLLAGTLACFISVFITPANSSYLTSNSISFLSKIPLALVFISKEINGREIWVPKTVPAIEPMHEDDGSIQDEYSQVANAFGKPGSKVIQDEEVVSDQPYPYISLSEEWKLAHLQSPYVLRRKQGSSSKKTISSDEAVGEIESEDGDDAAVSSSDEQDEEEDTVVPSSSSVEEEEDEDDEPIPQGEIEGPPEDYSSEVSPLPPPLNDESEEQGDAGSEEDEEESDERSSASSKIPLQALSHVDEVDEDDSTETNLELIPDEVKDAIVREMAKQFAQQTRISASKIKKEIKTTKPKRDNIVVDKSNDREVIRVTYDQRATDSDGPYNDEAVPEKKKPVRDRVTNSDGPYHEGKGKGKKKKKKGNGKGQGHGWGWQPPPKIWHPPPPPEHHHKPHIRDGLLEQWTRGSQWERILHSYHGWKDQQEYDLKHGHKHDDGEGPIHKHKPGLAQNLLKGSFWERAFVTYANYKKKQQSKGGHEVAGEGWTPYDR